METFHPHRTVLTVQGKEAEAFLQGLITNDVTKASQGLYGALLSPQGRFLYDFMVFSKDGVFYLTPETETAEELLKKVSFYKLRKDVALALAPELGVFLSPSPKGDLSFPDPRHANLGTFSLLPMGAAQSEAYRNYQNHRYGLGIPEGASEIGYDKGILLEQNLECALSWTKGCYMGQELMARSKHVGVVRKKVMPLHWQGSAPAVGDQLFLNEIPVGRITAVGDSVGLGLMRLEHLEHQKTFQTASGLQVSIK